jgi:hypothetical protein
MDVSVLQQPVLPLDVYVLQFCAVSGSGQYDYSKAASAVPGGYGLQQLLPHLDMSGLQLLKLEKGTKKPTGKLKLGKWTKK